MTARERLLEAAIRCLESTGYARTTTRDIVATAGSHLPAVNYYFGSKERLLEEAVVEALRRWAETTMVVARAPAGGTPRERLFRSVDRFLATLEESRPYVVAAVEAFAQAERSDELRRRLAEAYDDFRLEVARTLAATDIEDGDARPESRHLASVLIALFDGLAVQWLLDDERVPSADEVTASLELMAAALRGDARLRAD